MRQIPLSIFNRAAKPSQQPVVEEPVQEVTEQIPVTEVQEESVAEPEKTVAETEQEPATETAAEGAQAAITEEPAEAATEETDKSNIGLEEDTKEKIKALAEEEKPKRKRTKKTEEDVPVTSASMKMTGASKLPDAVALVCIDYEDPSYDEFMEHMNEAMLHTVFDERADAGVIKSILSNLSRCYDNATRKYAEVSTKLETISNKSYGLIMRQVAANSVGSNEAERKRAGLHAPEAYKAAGGKTVNLYAIEAGLRKQVTELQTIIRQIEFRKSAIIAYLTAEKMDFNA